MSKNKEYAEKHAAFAMEQIDVALPRDIKAVPRGTTVTAPFGDKGLAAYRATKQIGYHRSSFDCVFYQFTA